MVTGEVPGPVLFCSALVWERYRTDLLRVAPALDPVPLSPGRRVPVDDVGRIEIGFLSADLCPEQSANFVKVADQRTAHPMVPHGERRRRPSGVPDVS